MKPWVKTPVPQKIKRKKEKRSNPSILSFSIWEKKHIEKDKNSSS
jgi:hypothetical protein